MTKHRKDTKDVRVRINNLRKRQGIITNHNNRLEEISLKLGVNQNESEKYLLWKEASELNTLIIKENNELVDEIKRVEELQEINHKNIDVFIAYINMCQAIPKACLKLYEREF